MNVLLISDIHGSADCFDFVLSEAGKADLVLISGDITDFGDEPEVAALLAPILSTGAPIAAVSGNCDREGVRNYLRRTGLSVEGICRSEGELRLVGSGGGLRRKGFTPFEPTEEELEETLQAAISDCECSDSPIIVLTHTPPRGTDADLRLASHVGSFAFRELLDQVQPLLWIAGHIHEARSVSRKGSTLLINPGSLKEGSYAVVEIERSPSGWKADGELRR